MNINTSQTPLRMITQQAILFIIDYLRYTQTLPMGLAIFGTLILLFISLLIPIIPSISDLLFNTLSYFNVSTFQFSFDLDSADFFKLYGISAFVVYVFGTTIKHFTKFRLNWALRKRLLWAVILIIISYTLIGLFLSRISNDKSDIVGISIFLGILTIALTIYGMVANALLLKIRHIIRPRI